MSQTLRGADIVARSLRRLGCRQVFTLSGNHIMSIFDAALDAGLDLVHVRHEATAVHMADAHGRLTGTPGVALVTGGPGHANAMGALYTALGAESPLVLLSGHAATWELGRGGFQEIRQAEMAAPVTKASWTAKAAGTLGRDLGRAFRMAAAGRPGPVHLSLPSDVLEQRVASEAVHWPQPEPAIVADLTPEGARPILAAIRAAARPVIVAGPQLSSAGGRALLARLETATRAPAIVLESPRGMADATLGACAEVMRQADLLVLLGKALDFTLKWASGPAFDPELRLVVIDPDAAHLARARREKGGRVLHACLADARPAAEALLAAAAAPRGQAQSDGAWLSRARTALDSRPAEWATIRARSGGRLHPAEVFRALRPLLERDPASVLICDGGEFAQWGQAMLPVRRRLINGVAGSIGGSLAFALSARLLDPNAPIFVVLGDGTIGFHLAEFETAVRRGLPFVAVLGNDGRWNAESQIQLREYGANRMHGCELLPARYDLAVAALGGHGEFVDEAADLPGAIERALASGKPACVNVMIESVAAPAIRLPST